MIDQPRPEGQLDVQRWLGRCMLRLQQYERLMKTLLAHHELAGPVDTLEAQQAANVEMVSDKTLGRAKNPSRSGVPSQVHSPQRASALTCF